MEKEKPEDKREKQQEKIYTQSQLDAAISKAVETNAKRIRAVYEARLDEAMPKPQAAQDPRTEEMRRLEAELQQKERILDLMDHLSAAGLPIGLAELMSDADPEYAKLLISKIGGKKS